MKNKIMGVAAGLVLCIAAQAEITGYRISPAGHRVVWLESGKAPMAVVVKDPVKWQRLTNDLAAVIPAGGVVSTNTP